MAEEDDVESQQGHRTSVFRIVIKNFSSQWFLIPQGTGILAVILHQLHYQFHGLRIISQILWVLTIVLLISFLAIYSIRAIIFPRHVLHQLSSNILETACLSSVSIAFTTIIQMIALNLPKPWGQHWGLAAYGLWWINAAMAAACCIAIPYVFTKSEAPGIDFIPPGILLPCIAALTIAAGGGVVCQYGEISAALQVPVIIVSYLFIGLGLPLSVVCDAVFFARLFDKQWPIKERVYQLMILCGPLGQASFAMQILGNVVKLGAFATYNTSSFLDKSSGMTVAVSSEFLGIITWGYGTFWWGFACIGIFHYLITDTRELLKWDKQLTAWSMVFPWGVYTNAAIQLGVTLDSRAFWVWSTILTLILVMLWLANAICTLVGIYRGKIVGLDRGWRATYFASSAESEKEQQNGKLPDKASVSNGHATGNDELGDGARS